MPPTEAYDAALLASAVAWARIHGAGDDAEDVAQDALLRIWRRECAGVAFADYRARYRYLHLAVLSVVRDRQRSAAGRACVVPIEPWHAETPDGHEARLDLQAAVAVLRGLGNDGAVLLALAAGWSPAELAPEAQGYPWRVYAAAARARRALERYRNA